MTIKRSEKKTYFGHTYDVTVGKETFQVNGLPKPSVANGGVFPKRWRLSISSYMYWKRDRIDNSWERYVSINCPKPLRDTVMQLFSWNKTLNKK